jgi:hypothetical protein
MEEEVVMENVRRNLCGTATLQNVSDLWNILSLFFGSICCANTTALIAAAVTQ